MVQGCPGQPEGSEEESVCGREMEPEQERHCHRLVQLCEYMQHHLHTTWTVIYCTHVTHTQHPELLLVSYYTNPNVPHDPDGVVLMWDLKFQKDTPDYIFNCQVVPETYPAQHAVCCPYLLSL